MPTTVVTNPPTAPPTPLGALRAARGPARLDRQRYRVKGRGVVALPLLAGDQVEIVDPEGRQPASVVAFDASGKAQTAALGLTVTGNGDHIAALLSATTAAAERLRRQLKARSVDVKSLRAATLMQGDTPAGHTQAFTSHRDVICLIAATGKPMQVHQQTPATELLVYVTRAGPSTPSAAQPLPDSLADPLADAQQDFRIRAATAQSYLVKAGDYLQILDIDGQQCSDFQCFDAAKLEQGLERCLDATATRTLMGSAYPAPGLYSKFFDVDLEPLIEVVQDTCGRHDSFNLACTSKYYDEMGYPGHANCSDNFNLALADYAVAPRRGWMAMNLFFNTSFDDHYQLYVDEPWSRRGDYVLMQALRDLVCVSSSCSDDIDAANAWNPTDIQVRVYAKAARFKRAIAFRPTPDAEARMTQETGFHPETAKLTRHFIDYSGYWLANSYTQHGPLDEYWACRQHAAVIDLSPLRKYEVLGPDAEALLQHCVTRNIKQLGVGQVVYTAMCNPSGGMLDDGTVFRLGADNFRWVGGSDESGLWLRDTATQLGLKAWVKNSTDELHNLQVQGPNSLDILKQLVWTRADQANVAELNCFRFSIARLENARGLPLVVSRTGYTGELGYEIFCHPRHAVEVWQTLMRAGESHQLKPMGLEALDILRIEAGLIFAGYEFCPQTDPFEAGIGFTVPLKSKTDDFIGKQALLERKQHPQRRLVGLELDGQEVAAHGDQVYVGRQPVGEITSATRSPTLGKNIALCRQNIEFCAIGTAVEVGKLDGHQKRLAAKVVRFPHYDPEKTRVRGV